MPDIAYNQSNDPRWKSFASTRAGVCMALSAHYVIKALRGEDFWAWLAPPAAGARVALGATRQNAVQDVRFLYDQHDRLKKLHGDGYQQVENNFLKDYIATVGGRISGELVVARSDTPIKLNTLANEIGRLLDAGKADYASWASLQLNGAHAIAAVRGSGGTGDVRFFEPVLGERDHAGRLALMLDIAKATSETHGIIAVDRYLLMSFTM
jgi:hypothetical protein